MSIEDVGRGFLDHGALVTVSGCLSRGQKESLLLVKVVDLVTPCFVLCEGRRGREDRFTSIYTHIRGENLSIDNSIERVFGDVFSYHHYPRIH